MFLTYNNRWNCGYKIDKIKKKKIENNRPKLTTTQSKLERSELSKKQEKEKKKEH